MILPMARQAPLFPRMILTENRFTLFRDHAPSWEETTMRRGRILLTALAVLASAALFNSTTGAQTPSDATTPTPDNAVMLTIFLKHDQSRPLAELNAQLEKQG